MSGLIFVGIGLAFGIAASGYDIGTAFQMGPGCFPLVLAGFLVVLGLAITARGFAKAEPEPGLGVVPWRGLLLLIGAIVFFGATIRGLGLVPTVFLTLLGAALASTNNTLVRAVVLATGLTLFCVLVFKLGLGLTIPYFGTWLRV
jgi:hypothetical protein